MTPSLTTPLVTRTLTVRYFAAAKAAAGTGEETVALPGDATVADAVAALGTAHGPELEQVLLGLRGPTESPLTRFAQPSAFEPQVLSLVKCLLTGEDKGAYSQLVEQASSGSSGAT